MEIASTDEAVLGMGFDSVLGEFRSVGVQGAATDPSAMGQVGGSQFSRVTSWEEISKVVRVDAEVSAQFGIAGGSAKFSFADKMRASSQFTTVMVSINALNALVQIPSARLTPDASQLLAAGDTQRFAERFGDKFVRGIKTGGEFFGFIQIKAQSREREKQVAGEIGANYLTASVKVSASLDEELRTGLLTIDAFSWQTGGTVELHTDIDSMSNAARAFGASVKTLGTPVTAIVDDYTELDLPKGPSPLAIAEKRSFLSRMVSFMNRARQLSADIDYALLNPGFFEQMDAAVIEQLQALAPAVDAIRNQIKARVSACLNDLEACDQFTPVFPAMPPLVRKALTDAESMRARVEQFLKTVTTRPPKVKGNLGLGL